MNGFDFFRRSRDTYMPKTASTAMKAVEAGLLPREACLFLGTSIKPLNEEPFDLDDIERILSRQDLDLETNLLLVDILNKLLGDTDAEVALFAAESINTIESRYTRRIEALKEKLRGGEAGGESAEETPEVIRALAVQYYELAQLNPGSIRNFYLREAYGYFKRLGQSRHLQKRDIGVLVRLLLKLELPEQAAGIIARLKNRRDPYYLLLEAEVEFQRRNIAGILELCGRLKAHWQELDQGSRTLVAYWLGEQDG